MSFGLVYAGFTFTNADGVHYGWMQFANFIPAELVVDKIAWETLPSLDIRAGSTESIPEPSSFLLLAMGCVGLTAIGRRDRPARESRPSLMSLGNDVGTKMTR